MLHSQIKIIFFHDFMKKKPKHPYMLVGGGGQNVEVKDITWVLPSIILFCFGGKSMIFLISPLKEQGHN